MTNEGLRDDRLGFADDKRDLRGVFARGQRTGDVIAAPDQVRGDASNRPYGSRNGYGGMRAATTRG